MFKQSILEAIGSVEYVQFQSPPIIIFLQLKLCIARFSLVKKLGL